MTISDSLKSGEWVPLMRLGNWADLGYFESVLHEAEITTDLIQHEQSSAQDGRRTVTLVLLVPTNQAERAAEVLAAEMDEVRAAETEDSFDSPDATDWQPVADAREAWTREAGAAFAPQDESGLGLWKPVLLLIVAGGLTSLFWHRLPAVQEPDPIDPQHDLWHALSELERPLVSPPRGHSPGRRLWYDPQSGTLNLEEDFNGDGRYDRRRQFHPNRPSVVRHPAR